MKISTTLVLVFALASCGSDPIPVFGPPTESVCPPGGTTLTYANFGKPFMDTYCIECHDQHLAGPQRQGAPSFHDFDTYFGIVPVSDHVDETTAGGPAAMNRGMPPAGHPTPSDAERLMLGEWIACDLPEQ